MSASEAPALTAVTLQLVAALDGYEQDVNTLVQQRLDPEQYQRVSGHMDRMRQYASALPGLSAAWVEVMIRHFELTHALWREFNAQADPAQVQQITQDHLQAVRRLRRQALQLLAAPESARG